uniref:Uncharacterized protein n=1 Tax=uncultured nuHF1 cluster bacterium HF0130_31E21 TaxID=710728 RepID=E0XTK1_9BACT|nr:hypothetical protein [uncultured nuHF1 cluster bacterium HF0130_31E21]
MRWESKNDLQVLCDQKGMVASFLRRNAKSRPFRGGVIVFQLWLRG